MPHVKRIRAFLVLAAAMFAALTGFLILSLERYSSGAGRNIAFAILAILSLFGGGYALREVEEHVGHRRAACACPNRTKPNSPACDRANPRNTAVPHGCPNASSIARH